MNGGKVACFQNPNDCFNFDFIGMRNVFYEHEFPELTEIWFTNGLCSKTIEEEYKVDIQFIKQVSKSQIPDKQCVIALIVLESDHDICAFI